MTTKKAEAEAAWRSLDGETQEHALLLLEEMAEIYGAASVDTTNEEHRQVTARKQERSLLAALAVLRKAAEPEAPTVEHRHWCDAYVGECNCGAERDQ